MGRLKKLSSRELSLFPVQTTHITLHTHSAHPTSQYSMTTTEIDPVPDKVSGYFFLFSYLSFESGQVRV